LPAARAIAWRTLVAYDRGVTRLVRSGDDRFGARQSRSRGLSSQARSLARRIAGRSLHRRRRLGYQLVRDGFYSPLRIWTRFRRRTGAARWRGSTSTPSSSLRYLTMSSPLSRELDIPMRASRASSSCATASTRPATRRRCTRSSASDGRACPRARLRLLDADHRSRSRGNGGGAHHVFDPVRGRESTRLPQ